MEISTASGIARMAIISIIFLAYRLYKENKDSTAKIGLKKEVLFNKLRNACDE